MKIVIDPGHGGHDPGACGIGASEEADIALTISKELATNLEDLGLTVKLTRSTDDFVELPTRCDIANDWSADFFVSIHLNSDGPSACGIETLYTSPTGKELAAPVQAALVQATGDKDRGLKERNDLYVLNSTHMPAILVEVGFISHPQSEAKLCSTEYQHLIADAIADGLAQCFGLA